MGVRGRRQEPPQNGMTVLRSLRNTRRSMGTVLCQLFTQKTPNSEHGLQSNANLLGKLRGEKSNLSSKQYDKLLEIGFGANTKWYERFEELKKYKEEHGDCIVPIAYPENPELGAWVAKQRKPFWQVLNGKSSSLNAKQYGALSDMGFDDVWKERFEE